MNERVKTLGDEAAKLTPEEKADLLDRIHASLLDEADQVAERWDREAQARFTAYEEGAIKAVDWEEIKIRYSR
jgi:putative addiction module component (TIGR02574 family)